MLPQREPDHVRQTWRTLAAFASLESSNEEFHYSMLIAQSTRRSLAHFPSLASN